MKKIVEIIKSFFRLFKRSKVKIESKDPYEDQINQMIYEGSPVRDE
jgi:hypothetical protein